MLTFGVTLLLASVMVTGVLLLEVVKFCRLRVSPAGTLSPVRAVELRADGFITIVVPDATVPLLLTEPAVTVTPLPDTDMSV